MSVGLADIAPRLGKLIRLLGSDKEGERAAAIGAMTRTLQANNLSLHDLAEVIESAPVINEALASIDHAKRAAEQELQRAREYRKFQQEQASWHAIAVECQQCGAGILNEWESTFIGDMVRRTVHGGEPTEKQANCLRKIYTKVGKCRT